MDPKYPKYNRLYIVLPHFLPHLSHLANRELVRNVFWPTTEPQNRYDPGTI